MPLAFTFAERSPAQWSRAVAPGSVHLSTPHWSCDGAERAVTTGGLVSTTVTFGWQLAVLREGSVAEQLPGVVPRGKVAIVQLAVQLQLSLHVAVGVLVAPEFPVHSSVWLLH